MPPDEQHGTPSPEEALRLIHELQVHQIEREMHNEELRKAQDGLEASRARYFDLYDLAPVGYFTVSEQGTILEANLTAATLLGIERGNLLAQPLSRFVPPEEREVWQRHIRRVFESGELEAWEMRLLHAAGEPFWALLEAIVRPDVISGKRVCRLAHRRGGGREFPQDQLPSPGNRRRVPDSGEQLPEDLIRGRGAVVRHLH